MNRLFKSPILGFSILYWISIWPTHSFISMSSFIEFLLVVPFLIHFIQNKISSKFGKFLFGSIATLIWSEIANITTGNSNGPVARVVFFSGLACTITFLSLSAKSFMPPFVLMVLNLLLVTFYGVVSKHEVEAILVIGFIYLLFFQLFKDKPAPLIFELQNRSKVIVIALILLFWLISTHVFTAALSQSDTPLLTRVQNWAHTFQSNPTPTPTPLPTSSFRPTPKTSPTKEIAPTPRQTTDMATPTPTTPSATAGSTKISHPSQSPSSISSSTTVSPTPIVTASSESVAPTSSPTPTRSKVTKRPTPTPSHSEVTKKPTPSPTPTHSQVTKKPTPKPTPNSTPSHSKVTKRPTPKPTPSPSKSEKAKPLIKKSNLSKLTQIILDLSLSLLLLLFLFLLYQALRRRIKKFLIRRGNALNRINGSWLYYLTEQARLSSDDDSALRLPLSSGTSAASQLAAANEKALYALQRGEDADPKQIDEILNKALRELRDQTSLRRRIKASFRP